MSFVLNQVYYTVHAFWWCHVTLWVCIRLTPFPTVKKKGKRGKKAGLWLSLGMGGIAIISFLDSSPASKFALLENHWLRAWQSSSSFSESQMSPSGPSPLQWTRYWIFFPCRLLSTILSTKNSCCLSIKIVLRHGRDVHPTWVKSRFTETLGSCYEWTPISSSFTLLQVLIHHVILTFPCESLWLILCFLTWVIMTHYHESLWLLFTFPFWLTMTHYESCSVTYCPGWLYCPCDVYCPCDSIVLFYYKYWQSLALCYVTVGTFTWHGLSCTPRHWVTRVLGFWVQGQSLERTLTVTDERWLTA